MKEGEAVDEKAEEEEQNGAAEGVKEDGAAADTGGQARCGGEDKGDADQEQKGRKDEVGGGEAVPDGVFEGPVGVGVVAGAVDQDHEGDGGAAEEIER